MTEYHKSRLQAQLQFAVEQSLDEARTVFQVAEGPLRLIVGVSGGEDSHVLLNLLSSLQRRQASPQQLQLIVAHVDHGIRPESAADARFVENLAADYQVSFELFTAPPRPPQENLEAWGRRIRYEFFMGLLQKYQAHAVVTAHHQNDQAETVLFRFLSGRMLTSARGIVRCDVTQRRLRPLLNIPKANIQEYAQERSLVFVHDESNSDLRRRRNLIRHELLPQLIREQNPNLTQDLSLLACRFQEDEDFLDEKARELLNSAKLPQGADQLLKQLSPALRWRLLRALAIQELGEDAGRVGYHAWKAAVELLIKQDLSGPKTIELGFGYSLSKHPGKGLTFEKIP